MAEGKKSFLFYTNWGNTFDELSDDDAGKLIKHICDYVRDKNPQTDSILIKAVFANIKSILKMDLDKWEAKSLKNSENAKIRWDKKDANVCERIKPNANHADIVNDIVNDIVIDNVIVNDNVKESEINRITHPALIGFRKNVLKEAKEQGIENEVAEEFFIHWTAIDENSKDFLFQATKPFGIQNRLKNWQKIESKNNSTVKKVDPKTIVL